MPAKDIMNIGLINLICDEEAPPMNLVYLASYLKKYGFKVKIIDPTYERIDFKSQLREFDLLGISAMTGGYNRAIKLARQLKGVFAGPIIIGGAHISALPHTLSQDFNLGVIGEGEEALLKLCRILKDERGFRPFGLAQLPGIVYWQDGKLALNNPCQHIADLDSLPMPEFNLLHKGYFRKRWLDWSRKTGVSIHISTSRGCPYTCAFCSTQKLWQGVRFQSARRIFNEAKELVIRYKVNHISIDDDLFLAQRARLEELAGLMEGSEIDGRVVFYCTGRANLIDEGLCRILKRTGIQAMNFGFESGSDRVLQSLKGDNVTVHQNRVAIELCRKYGFEISGNVILGSPGETIEDMRQTLKFMDFAIARGCYKIGVFLMTPLPGTPIWEIAKKRNRVSEGMDWGRLSFYNYKDPLLLDEGIERRDFEEVFQAARNKSYRAWLKNRWWKILLSDSRRAFRKITENPLRAVIMLSNVLLNKKE